MDPMQFRLPLPPIRTDASGVTTGQASTPVGQSVWAPVRKRALGVFAALAILAAGAWAMWPKPVPVDVAAVSAGPMAVTVDEEGKTRIKDIFSVSAPISGTMLRSPLQAGDIVEKAKTIVAVIQPVAPPFLDFRTRLEATAQVKASEAGVALSEAELAQTRSELGFAESELTRARSLSRSSTIATRALEKAQLDVDVRRAAVAKAEAGLTVQRRHLESVRARLVGPTDDPSSGVLDTACCVDVRSPESGRVLKVLHTSEQAVQIGTPLLEIGDPASLEIVVELLSSDAIKIREGAPAIIDSWGGSRPLTARVRRIESAGFTKVSALGIEEQRVRVVLDLLGADRTAHGLGHEFRVFARIRQWEASAVARVPIGALFRTGRNWAVFKSVDGRAVLSTIEIGHRNADFAEVLAGLRIGDRVVLHPSDRLVQGGRIAERTVEPLGNP